VKISRQFTGGKPHDQRELVPEARLKLCSMAVLDVSTVPPGRIPHRNVTPGVGNAGLLSVVLPGRSQRYGEHQVVEAFKAGFGVEKGFGDEGGGHGEILYSGSQNPHPVPGKKRRDRGGGTRFIVASTNPYTKP
jgi:hypothetical protein